jgi:hypothetical protein
MRENINHVDALESLTEVTDLSESHYCASFKRKTIQTPMQLFTSNERTAGLPASSKEKSIK